MNDMGSAPGSREARSGRERGTADHTRWRTTRTRKLLGKRVEESPACLAAGHSLALGQAVYDRRTALGLPPAELARRAGLTPSRIAAIEGGDAEPVLPLLTRLAKALQATLTIRLDGDDISFVFTAGGQRDGRPEPDDS